MKRVLITGCSSGFGMALVQAFLEQGDFVICTMRNANERRDLFKELKKLFSQRLIIMSLDVTKETEREAVAKYIEENLNSKLDILINNAGYGHYGALEDSTEKQIRDQFEVNFFGAMALIKITLPFLRSSKGKIINISSLMGRFSLPLGGVYSASKYALEGLSEGLFYELKRHGVSICTMQPGGHRTNFAKSIVWAANADEESSAYKMETSALKTMMNKMMTRKNAPDESGVVKAVMKFSNNSSCKRRVLVGRDAVLTGLLQKILPERFYHSILSYFYANMINKGFK